jgi:sugar O-acyltransferase (sialic acid O-acetyltransferase NeuD family)
MKYIKFGTGGFAKEIISYLNEGDQVVCAVSTQPFDNPVKYPYPVKEKLEPGEFLDAGFLLCVGDPALKRKLVSFNENRWVTFIHKSATVSPQSEIGQGSIVGPNTVITSDARLGQFVTLNLNCCVAHDCTVGEYTTFSPYASVMGHCTVGTDCFFGTSALCVPKVSLPSYTKISAGAVVRKSITEPTTLYGDPAGPRK